MPQGATNKIADPNRGNLMKATRAIASLVFLTLGLLAVSPAQAVDYTFTDLGMLGGANSQGSRAVAINNAGQIVGYSDITTSVHQTTIFHGFIYSNGTMADIGTLGYTESYASSINDMGYVVGSSPLPSGNSAFLYHDGVMKGFDPSPYSVATGINNAGQIIGSDQSGLFLYSGGSGGVFTNLGTLGGTPGSALGINSSGQVVGNSGIASGYYHAFLYSNGQMNDIGTFGGDSFANAINDAGQIVGYSQGYANTGYQSHALLYSGGSLTDLGSFGGSSIANSINSAGQIVGTSTTTTGSSVAFLYQNGAMTNLNDLMPCCNGWSLYQASDINDSGQIVGNAYNFNDGQTHAFLLTPTGVPLPSTVWLLMSGILTLIGMAKIRTSSTSPLFE